MNDLASSHGVVDGHSPGYDQTLFAPDAEKQPYQALSQNNTMPIHNNNEFAWKFVTGKSLLAYFFIYIFFAS